MNKGKKVTGYVSGDIIAGLVDTASDTDSMPIKLTSTLGMTPKRARSLPLL